MENNKGWAVRVTEQNVGFLQEWRGDTLFPHGYLTSRPFHHNNIPTGYWESRTSFPVLSWERWFRKYAHKSPVGFNLTSDFGFPENTIGWWLKQLPGDNYQKAYNNVEKQGTLYCLFQEMTSLISSLASAFVFCSSPEGHTYWEEIPLTDRWFVLYDNEDEFNELNSYYKCRLNYVEIGGGYTPYEERHCVSVIHDTHKDLLAYGCKQLTMQQWRDYFKKSEPSTKTTEKMKEYFVTRESLIKIYKIACPEWQTKIYNIASTIPALDSGICLREDQIDEMFAAAMSRQLPVLREIFPGYLEDKEKHFDSSVLKIGEWMVVDDIKYREFNNHILLKTNTGVVSVGGPENVWSWAPEGVKIKGRKVPSGTEITIIAK